MYKILKNVCFPKKPKEKSYNELVSQLAKHFKGKSSIFKKRIEFDNLRQGNEPINKWHIRVKRAAAPCEFGEHFTERVKDKFVTGLKPGTVSDRLCEESVNKSLEDLLEIALAKESTLKEASINAVHPRKSRDRRKLQERKWFTRIPRKMTRCWYAYIAINRIIVLNIVNLKILLVKFVKKRSYSCSL